MGIKLTKHDETNKYKRNNRENFRLRSLPSAKISFDLDQTKNRRSIMSSAAFASKRNHSIACPRFSDAVAIRDNILRVDNNLITETNAKNSKEPVVLDDFDHLVINLSYNYLKESLKTVGVITFMK